MKFAIDPLVAYTDDAYANVGKLLDAYANVWKVLIAQAVVEDIVEDAYEYVGKVAETHAVVELIDVDAYPNVTYEDDALADVRYPFREDEVRKVEIAQAVVDDIDEDA